LTAVFFAYLGMCALPSYIWSRKSHYHPVWRGIESFACYLVVALVLGAIFAASDGGDWSVLSGIAASGEAWARIGSVTVMMAVFILASWWGSKAAGGRRKHVDNRGRLKGKAPVS
jgi:hypothetical protein